MAAFLLENGADLNVVAGYLASALDARHLDLFSRMLEEAETRQLGGLRLGLCVQDADKSMTMLPNLVSRFMEIKGLDLAFGIFPLSATRTAVIGRASAREFDVGALLRHLGGGLGEARPADDDGLAGGSPDGQIGAAIADIVEAALAIAFDQGGGLGGRLGQHVL